MPGFVSETDHAVTDVFYKQKPLQWMMHWRQSDLESFSGKSLSSLDCHG